MRKKQFKTESRKMLDMMINSIYTHKEIFLRELISNASDAIDKRYFRALTDTSAGLDRGQYAIVLERDPKERTLTITDNGCGMTQEELENNLGTIARSGSQDFKQDNETAKDVSIIGQFGVGFYSAFMVSDHITVESRAIGADTAWRWESEGADGYTVEPCDYAPVGSRIRLHLKSDTETEHYSEFLEEFRLRQLVKKYSDYIRYPIRMEVEKSRPKPLPEGEKPDENKQPEYETYTEVETLNSMVPIWHRPAKEVTDEEYKNFYCEKFMDYDGPARTIRTTSDGTISYEALLFVPKRAPFNYYTKSYEKGLQLYSNGVMIMERCPDLLPDHFSFVRGLVDSQDFTLNISRETLQHDHQLKIIAKALEKKIHTELAKMMETQRDEYESFFGEFGVQLKYGLYAGFGANKETLQDLLLFRSSHEKKYVSLKEYVARMPEGQKDICYACGETADAIDLLPQTEAVKAKGWEVLYLTDDVDEFALKALHEYEKHSFVNVCDNQLDLASDEEKARLKEANDGAKEMLDYLKESLGGAVSSVQFTNSLKEHPVCLSTQGGISTEMEKVLGKIPGNEKVMPKAETVLEINLEHPAAAALKEAFAAGDKEKAARYAKILYTMGRMISGLPVENPTELSNLVCGLMK